MPEFSTENLPAVSVEFLDSAVASDFIELSKAIESHDKAYPQLLHARPAQTTFFRVCGVSFVRDEMDDARKCFVVP